MTKIHPMTIIAGYRMAAECARNALLKKAIDNKQDPEKFKLDLMKIAMTTLSSKILSQDKEHFAALAVDAVMRLKGSTNLESIQIIKKAGGSLRDSYLDEAGKLVGNKILWRGDSALKDGSDAKLDLSKGMYDAGDHMKFNFPMAFTATVLSWSILEYGDQIDKVNQLDSSRDSLRWITDYLIKFHPKDNVLYIQVHLMGQP